MKVAITPSRIAEAEAAAIEPHLVTRHPWLALQSRSNCCAFGGLCPHIPLQASRSAVPATQASAALSCSAP
jgi:hypothetical protein